MAASRWSSGPPVSRISSSPKTWREGISLTEKKSRGRTTGAIQLNQRVCGGGWERDGERGKERERPITAKCRKPPGPTKPRGQRTRWSRQKADPPPPAPDADADVFRSSPPPEWRSGVQSGWILRRVFAYHGDVPRAVLCVDAPGRNLLFGELEHESLIVLIYLLLMLKCLSFILWIVGTRATSRKHPHQPESWTQRRSGPFFSKRPGASNQEHWAARQPFKWSNKAGTSGRTWGTLTVTTPPFLQDKASSRLEGPSDV